LGFTPVLIGVAYTLFVLDAGVWCKADTPQDGVCTWGYWIARLQWWPFARTQDLGWFPSWLVRDLGFRVVHPRFWIAALWAGSVTLGAGLVVWRSPGEQRRARLATLVPFTVVGIFVLPELIAPLLVDRPERLLAVALPWPLAVESLVDGPVAAGSSAAAGAWIGLGLAVSGIAMPLHVLRHGRRFCSAFCPYGAIASTLGVVFEPATIRGAWARRLQGLGVLVLIAAIVVTGYLLADGWGPTQLGPGRGVVAHGYRTVVLLGGLGVVGLGLAPLLGPRIWCRWLCPLGSAMDLLARRFPAVAVRRVGSSSCDGCASCSSSCIMGIEVADVVKQDRDVTNAEGPCIQCGLCVDACPDGALVLVQLRPRRSG
jgi:NAD-dependent dihydropyrimidine dehydrogenase PreA subunit